MGAVADVVSSVVDTASSAVSSVGDAVSDVGNAVVTQVVQPVVKAVDNTVKAVEADPVGAIAKIGTAIVAPELLPLVSAADTIAKGGSIDDALKSAATTYVAQGVGQGVSNYVNAGVDSAGAANTYGTDVGSQQSNMLAQQESGLGTAGDVAGNVAGTVAGGVASGIVRGQDPLTALKNSGISAGTTAVTDQIPGFSDLPPSAKAAVNATVSATLMGGDPSQALVNAAINQGIAEAKNQNQQTKTAGLDPATQQIVNAFQDAQTQKPTDPGVQIAALSPTNQQTVTDSQQGYLSGALNWDTASGRINKAVEADIASGYLKPNGDGTYTSPDGVIYSMNSQTGMWDTNVGQVDKTGVGPDQPTTGGLDAITPPVTDNILSNNPVSPPQQTTNDPLTAQEAPPVTLMEQKPTTGGLPTVPANVAAASSTVTPSTLDTVAQTNQTALNTAIQTNNPDLVSAVVNNNAPVIAALAGGDVATATNLVGSTSNVPAPPVVNENQTAVSDTKPPVDLTPVNGPLSQTENAPTGVSGTSDTAQQTTGPLTNLTTTPTQTSSSSSILPTAAAAAATVAGANTMGTSGTSGVQLDYTPHFVKGSPINLVGAPTFETSYISPQQMQMQAPSPYTPGMQGFAEGSSVSMQPQFARGRAQFLQGLMSPMMRPQVGHMQFQRHSDGHSVEALGNTAFPQLDVHPYEPHSEGHSVDGGEHVPEFYSEGGLKSIDHTYVTGDGDGTSDSIPAMLANGEFVIPADVVASLGNGSNESGASVLDQFMKTIREHKRDAHPDHLPPDSKGPLAYLQEAQKKVT